MGDNLGTLPRSTNNEVDASGVDTIEVATDDRRTGHPLDIRLPDTTENHEMMTMNSELFMPLIREASRIAARTENQGYGRVEMENLVNELNNKISKSARMAKIYSWSHKLITLIIIGVSLSIMIINLLAECKNNYITVCSVFVFGIKSVHELLHVGQQGTHYKHASLKYRTLFDGAKEKLVLANSSEEFLRYIRQAREEMTRLEMTALNSSQLEDIHSIDVNVD